ncbi:hypothetical protein JCM19302_2920 [Jejuia pallidilutea]|uniref:Uncharacterized protein n=1 Tax=Jejuia pallidilutea TaxID=504487 RepID=A0A090W1T9_9FLAO|nr:hypothetical protein JCM19302_2920 [Jejuia pallidilutea]
MLIFPVSFSCSDDDSAKPGCYQDENRKIINTVLNVKGTVLGPVNTCGNIYRIKPDSAIDKQVTEFLDACNITDDFLQDGLSIEFSGYLYETFETEDVCANPFEITKIDKL